MDSRFLKAFSRISILGYGVTTKPIVAFLNAQGVACDIYDDAFVEAKSESFGTGAESKNANVDSRDLDSALDSRASDSGTHNTFAPSSAFDANHAKLEIISPGIPPAHKYFSKAKHIISEYDFVWNLLGESLSSAQNPAHAKIANAADSANAINTADSSAESILSTIPMIWISGTNGKTTTTQMLTFLLERFGAQAGGNIGTPLIHLATNRAKIWVLETSSFAMHYTHRARPQVYLLLPLSPDHISWHGGFDGYVRDKLSVLARMDSDSFALLPYDLREHPLVREYVESDKSDKSSARAESSTPNKSSGGKAIFYKDSSDLCEFLGVEKSALKFGEPFLLDALVALCGVRFITQTAAFERLGAPASALEPSTLCAHLNSFTIGAHRIEEFCELDARGRKWLWVDDSKGTNVDATLQAIKRYKDKALFLILGGDDKGADCEEIFLLLAHIAKSAESKGMHKGVQIFTIGSNEEKLLKLAKKHGVKASACQTLEVAVNAIKSARGALEKAESKKADSLDSGADFAKVDSSDFVGLLSPAAASLDQFSSYKERGDLFKKYAMQTQR